VPATMRDGCVVWVRGDEVGMRFVG
jgi:hypothetical protein